MPCERLSHHGHPGTPPAPLPTPAGPFVPVPGAGSCSRRGAGPGGSGQDGFELPEGLRAALQGHRQSPGEGCGAVPWAGAGKVPPGPGHLNAAVLGEMPKGSPGGWSRDGAGM